jgi:hypothetical protein
MKCPILIDLTKAAEAVFSMALPAASFALRIGTSRSS